MQQYMIEPIKEKNIQMVFFFYVAIYSNEKSNKNKYSLLSNNLQTKYLYYDTK